MKGFLTRECPVCFAEISRHQLDIAGCCGELSCRAIIIQQRNTVESKRLNEEWNGKSDRIRDAVGTDVVANVPHNSSGMIDVAGTRPQELAQHLDTILDQAFSDETIAPDMDRSAMSRTVQDPVTNAACSACQGWCCRAGRWTNAYLTPETIARLRRDFPDMTRAEIKAHYLSKVPERSIEESCIFHTNKGCALERPFRASICNTYECWQLKRTKTVAQENPGAQMTIGAFKDDLEKTVELSTPAPELSGPE